MGISAVLSLLNLAIPNIVNLVVAIKHKTGGATVTVILDEADAQFATNQQQIADWFQQHPSLKPPTVPTAPPTA